MAGLSLQHIWKKYPNGYEAVKDFNLEIADKELIIGVDIMFCVMESCPHKEAAYEVLDFLLDPENIQAYVDEQNSVPCQTGNFRLTPMLDGMRKYIDAGKMADYHDHHYPSEMAVDAQIQTYLIHGDADAFLAKFDKDWVRYNRDVIAKLKKCMAEH